MGGVILNETTLCNCHTVALNFCLTLFRLSLIVSETKAHLELSFWFCPWVLYSSDRT